MWPLWRIVRDAHIGLTELDRWSLDEIRQFNSVLDMGASYESALHGKEKMDEDIAKAKADSQRNK